MLKLYLIIVFLFFAVLLLGILAKFYSTPISRINVTN